MSSVSSTAAMNGFFSYSHDGSPVLQIVRNDHWRLVSPLGKLPGLQPDDGSISHTPHPSMPRGK